MDAVALRPPRTAWTGLGRSPARRHTHVAGDRGAVLCSAGGRSGACISAEGHAWHYGAMGLPRWCRVRVGHWVGFGSLSEEVHSPVSHPHGMASGQSSCSVSGRSTAAGMGIKCHGGPQAVRTEASAHQMALPPPPPWQGQGGRGRSQGGEKPRGTAAHGGKGSKGRAANGDRPVGAASSRRWPHANPPAPRAAFCWGGNTTDAFWRHRGVWFTYSSPLLCGLLAVTSLVPGLPPLSPQICCSA